MQNTIEAAYLDFSDGLTRFLCTQNVMVLDVVRGAAPGTRRLLLGERTGAQVTHVVAISRSSGSATPIDNEHAVLEHAGRVLRPAFRGSLPEVIERLDVGTSVRGLAMTAVPGLGSADRRPRTSARELLAAMSEWLGAVWADTAEGSGPVDLGGSCVRAVLAQSHPTPMPQPAAVDIVRRARARLADFERTLASDGALILKFWMHLGKDAQKKRLEKLEKDIALFADAMPPDPRGTSPGIRAAEFTVNEGQLNHIFLQGSGAAPLFDIGGDLTEEQRATLLKLTERYCVVYQTLRASPAIDVTMRAAA